MPRGTAAIVLVVFCTCPAVIRPSCSATTRMTHGTAKKSSASDIFLAPRRRYRVEKICARRGIGRHSG